MSKKIGLFFVALVLALTSGLVVACSEVDVTKKKDKSYTVTYYYNYDGAPNSGVYRTDKVDKNTAAKKPVNPTRTDHTFTDWTTDAAGKVSYNFSKLVAANLKLYAQWRQNDIAAELVSIDAVVTKQFKVGDTFSKSDITVTAKYSDNTERTVTDFTYSPNPDMSTAGQKTITVTYAGKTKEVKFNVAARPIERALDYINIVRPTKRIYTVGEELDLTGLKVTAVYTDESEENVEVADCTVTGYDKDELGDQMITVTYGGKFKTFTVTVAYLEGIHIITEPNKTDYDVGDRLDLTGIVVTADYGNDATIIQTEYLTEGDFDVSGFDSSVEGDQTVTISYKGLEDSFTVYVTKAERTVSFVTGVAGMENPAAQTVDKYAKITEPDGDFSREGYDFDGWFRDGDDDAYDFDAEVTEYFTLTAKWTAIEYAINYVIENDEDGNPYAVAPEQVTYTIEDAVDLLDPTDVKEGYTFIGWYDEVGEDEEGNVVYDDDHKVTGIELGSMGEKTFYARITPIRTFVVTFNYNYDETPITREINVQEFTTATALNPAPTRTGYVFDGWYKEAECLNAWDFETETVTEAVELFAKWNIAVYTVTFDPAEGTMPEEALTQPVEYNKLAVKPANPTRDYPFTFGGWTLNGSIFDFNTPITEDVTLVASWWYDVQHGSFLHIRANDSSAWEDKYGASSHNEDSEWKIADVKLQVGSEFLVVEHGDGWDNWYNAQDGFTQWNATDVITVAFNGGNFKVTKMASGYANLTWTLYIKKDGWGISLVPRNANEKRSPAVTSNVTWAFSENRPDNTIFIAGTFTDGFKYHQAWSRESAAMTVLDNEGVVTFRKVYLKKNDAFKIVDYGAWLSGSFEALDQEFWINDGYSEDIALTSISNGWYDIIYKVWDKTLKIVPHQAATISGIEVELRYPNKAYYVGCTIQKTDLLVRTVNTDGVKALISAYTINHPDTSTPGAKWFSVSYGGLEGWVKVDVKNTKSGAFLYILTDVAAGKWEEKYSAAWQDGDYGAEWKVTGVKLQVGTKFLVVDYKQDGTDWYHSSGEYFGHNYEDIITIVGNGDNYEVTWINSAYLNASWTMTIKPDGTYVYLELPQNGVEKRTPDGSGTLTFGDNVGDKIYIAGNFTDDFKYNKDWSTESTKMTVLNNDGVYVFRGVYLKQGDRFKIVDNGNWKGGNFSVVGSQFDIGDGGDIMLFALTNGKYDVVYDSVNNKLTIRAYAATTLSSIELTPPAKTEYTLGEDLDIAGMAVKAVYANGDKSNVALSACTVTGYNKAQTGSQTVTVTYGGKTKTFTVTVNEPQSSYTVTFDSKGGSEVASQDVDYGEAAVKPADPARYGYIFGGWYKDENCTVEWNFDTDKVTSATTLYAKWTEDETVGYFLHILTDVNADKWEDLDAVLNPENNGEVIIDGVHLSVGTKFLTYKGNNWYHAIGDDFTQYGGYDDIITIGVDDGNYIVTAVNPAYVDAVWKLYVKKYDSNSISIELSRNADESRATNGEGTLEFGERPNDKIFIAGNFTGGFMYHQDWSTDSEVITVLKNNGVYTFRGVYLKKNDAFKIVDNGNWKGGSFVAVGTELNLNSDRNITLAALADGLYDIVYDSVNNKLTIKTYVPAAIASIYIKTGPTKTTYFKGEPFDDEGLVVTATDTEGMTKVVTDYTLEGNNTDTTGIVTVAVKYGNLSLTFYIEVSMINVTFMDGESELTDLAVEAEYNQKLTVPTDPTRDGYTFGGWYKEEACTNAWNFDTDTVTEDTTLYAKWLNAQTGTYLRVSTDNGTTWKDLYTVEEHNDEEWKVLGVKLQKDMQFQVVVITEDGEDAKTAQYGMSQYAPSTEIIKVIEFYGKIKVEELAAAYASVYWNLYIKKEGYGISLEIVLNGDENRAPDGEGSLEFGNNPSDKIFIAGNFTGGFNYNEKWSTDNVDIVTNDNGVYTFHGVYLKQCDRFKIVNNGAWLGGNFTAVGADIELSSDCGDITLYALATGKFDIVYDSNDNTLTINAYVPTVTTVSIEITAQPTKTSYFKGETFSADGLEVTATYSDGTTAVVTGTLGGNSTDTVGTITVTVTYDGKTATFTITVSQITVTFKDGNTVLNTVNVDYNGKVDEPTAPTKAGYKFDGWALDGIAYNFGDGVTEPIVLTAEWTKLYTVTFDTNGGSDVDAIENVEHGSTITAPTAPTKDGFTFAGWTLNGSAFDFDTAITGDITLVATWDGDIGTFLYYSNNGADNWLYGYTAEKNGDENGLVIRNVKIYDGMKFLVATKAAEGSGAWLKSGMDESKKFDDVVTVANDGGDFKITLSDPNYNGSIWNIYLYDLSDGANVSANGDLDKDTWAKISMVPVRDDTLRAADGTTMTAEEATSATAEVYIRGNFTKGFGLYNEWSSAENNGNVLVKKSGNTYTFRNVYLKKGDGFKIYLSGTSEWLGGNFEQLDKAFAVADGGTSNIYLGESFTNGYYDIIFTNGENKTVTIVEYAQATTDYITITTEPNKTAYYKGEAFNADGLVVTATDTDGNSATVTDYTLTNDNTNTAGTITVTVTYDGKSASFTIEVTQITVTFDSDGGSNVDSISVDYNGTISAPTAPAKDGYTFGGWTLDGSAYTFGTPITAPITLTATWTAETYTITYVLDGNVGGTIVEATISGETTAYTIETDTFTLAIPTVTTDGIHFLAWHLGSSSGETVTAITKGTTGNITLYAEYTQNATVDLVFNYNYGETPETKTVKVISGTAGAALSPAPSRTGYDFGGWYTDAACTNAYGFPIMDGDQTVYAKWDIQSFTVTFKDGNTVLDSLTATVDYDGTVTKPADPTKEGHRFDGWYKNEALTTVWDFENDKVTTDTTIYAKWTAVYTVTFDSNGGSAVAAITDVEHGSKITKPADPTKDGFTFTGWTLDGNEFDFDTAITADITLVAAWAGDTGTFLRYTVNGTDWVYGYKAAKNAEKNELVITGVKIYNDMEFVVVTQNAAGNSIWLNAGLSAPAKFSNDAITVSNVNGNFKFTFTDESYNGSGWTIYLYSLTDEVTVGEDGALDKNTYACGISLVARNGDENRAPDGTIGGLTFGEVPAGAIYIAGTFTDGFKYDKAWSTASDDITVLNKNGVYTFRGVQLKKNDAFKIVNNGTWLGGVFTAVGTEFGLSDTDDILLAALNNGKYDIVYNTNNSTLKIVAYADATTDYITVTAQPTKTTYALGEAFSADGLVITATDTDGNSKTVSGYTFSGNSTNVAGTITVTVTYDNKTATFTITVNPFTVTYNANGGTLTSSATATVTVAGGKLTKPSDPTRDGHGFDGWYKEEACTNAWNFATDTVTGNITLYAKWTVGGYTLKYVYGNGTAESTLSVVYGTSVTLEAAPSKVGYTFGGWNDGTTTHNAGASFTMPASDVTLTAVWNEITYTINYSVGGGTNGANKGTYKITEPDFTLVAATAPATYYFVEWQDKNGDTVTKLDSSIIALADNTNTITLTAVYDNKYTVTFSANGGVLDSTTTAQKVTYGGKATKPAKDPTRNSYDFKGWYKEAACTTEWNFATDTVTGNVTIYAGWRQNPKDGTFLYGTMTGWDEDFAKFKAEAWNYDQEWKISGVTLADGAEFVFKSYDADGNNTGWINPAYNFEQHSHTDIFTVSNSNNNFKIAYKTGKEAYANAIWTIYVKKDGKGISFAISGSEDTNRKPDGTTAAAFTETGAADVYIMGNFTNGFKQNDDWSSSSTVIPTAKSGNKYYFANVFFKQNDALKIKKGDDWFGLENNDKKLTVTADFAYASDNDGNIVLLAQDGYYDVVFDGVAKTLSITAHKAVVATLKAGAQVFVGTTPDASKFNVTVNGTATAEFTVIAQPAVAGSNTVTIICGNTVAKATYTSTSIAVSSVVVTKNPTKTVYKAGDTLDLAGIEVTVTNNDGSIQVVSATGLTANATSLTTSGSKTITVTVNGTSNTATFTVTVNALVVTFNSHGGTDVTAINCNTYNTTITAPAAPTRNGYEFEGWYTDEACTSAWNFASDKVTADITLHAKWNNVSGLKLHILNNGTWTDMNAESHNNDTEIKVTGVHLAVGTKFMPFKGDDWYHPNSTIEQYTYNAPIVTISSDGDGYIVDSIHADYANVLWTLYIKKDGSGISLEVPTNAYENRNTKGTGTLQYSATGPNNTIYIAGTFTDGYKYHQDWSLESTAITVLDERVSNKRVSFRGVYLKKNDAFKIVYNGVWYGGNMKDPLLSTGGGISTQPDTDGSSAPNIVLPMIEDGFYNIVFSIADSHWCRLEIYEPPTIASVEITKQPNKTTYFVGETFSDSGMTVTITDSEGKTHNNDYKATMDGVDLTKAFGANAVGTKTVKVTYAGTLGNPDNKAATFNITVKYITVTFNMNYTGATDSTGTATYNGVITKPADPSRAGYTFGGWYTDAACTTEWNFTTGKVTADKTLYAKWTRNIEKGTFLRIIDPALGANDDNWADAYTAVTHNNGEEWKVEGVTLKEGLEFLVVTHGDNGSIWYNTNSTIEQYTFDNVIKIGTQQDVYGKYCFKVTMLKSDYANVKWSLFIKQNGTGISLDVPSNANENRNPSNTGSLTYGESAPAKTVYIAGNFTQWSYHKEWSTNSTTMAVKIQRDSENRINRVEFRGVYLKKNDTFKIVDNNFDANGSWWGGYLDLQTQGFQLSGGNSHNLVFVMRESGYYNIIYNNNGGEDKNHFLRIEEYETPTIESTTVTAPTKTTYLVGETFSTAGMVVTITDTDGRTYNTQYTMTDTSTITSTAGTKTVTITYNGTLGGAAANKTASFTITVNAITVTYNSNGGSAVSANTSIKYNNPIITQPTTTRAGYTLDGWYNGSTKWVFGASGTKVTGDVTLTAHWTIVTYNITYVVSDATLGTAPAAGTYTVEQAVTLSNPTNIKSGYTFVGWYTTSGLTGSAVSSIAKGSTGDKTFYAKIAQVVTVNLIFNYNYTGAPADTTVKVVSGEAGSALSPAPTRTGYTFGGWYTTSNCTTAYTFPTMTANTTVYAKWNPINYTVTYYVDGSVSNTAGNPTTYNIDNGTVTLKNPSKTGYTFDGWYTSSSYTGTKVTSLTYNGLFAGANAANAVPLYGRFNINKYTVTFNANGGSGAPAALTNVTYNTTITQPTTEPTRAGYKFGGWYKESGCTNAWNFTTDKVTGNVTLYAKWTAIVAPTGSVAVGTDTVYLVGKFGNSDVTYEYGFKMTENPDNSSEHYITKKLEVGDMFAGWHKGWAMWVAKIENSDLGSKFEVVTVDGKSYIKVKAGAAGTYTLYCKHYGGDNDQFWISGPAVKLEANSAAFQFKDALIVLRIDFANFSGWGTLTNPRVHMWKGTGTDLTGGWNNRKSLDGKSTYNIDSNISDGVKMILTFDENGGNKQSVDMTITSFKNGKQYTLTAGAITGWTDGKFSANLIESNIVYA